MTDQIGRVLSGRYRLIAAIGSGASAQVYLADDVRLRRRVAVKLLHPALADDESFLRRFRAEAQAAAALSHPHVLAVYDWGDDDGGPYLVTEYLAGGSLRGMLDRGHRLSTSQALLVGLEALRALDVAHRRGFVHRDIKPANLLFGADGRLRIADFGLARAIAEAAWTEPQGAVLGTARYASPEQVKGESIDGRADVYSLGLVIIESVTGRVPFAADSTIATLMGRVDRQVEVSEALGPLRGALERAGRPDAADRPDAGELAISFMAAAQELPRPEPLPLAGPAAGAAEVRPGADEPDRTVLGRPEEIDLTAAAPAPAISSGGESGDVPDWDGTDGTVVVDDDHTEIGAVATWDDDLDSVPDLDEPRRRRRRWPYAVVAVLLAALLGGATAWGVMTLRTPTHEVPRLVGLQESEVRRLVNDYAWRIEANETRQDDTAPGQVLRTEPEAGEQLEEGGVLQIWVSLGNELAAVPTELTEMTGEEATEAIEAAGFVARPSEDFHEEVEVGRVISVDRDLPAQLPKGEEIPFTVSRGPQPRVVPDGLAGMTPEEATAALEEIQLRAEVTEAFNDDVPAGQVIESRPGAGAEVPRGEAVELVVSRGPDLVEVPDVSGMNLNRAIEAIESAGLAPGDVFGPANGRPFDTEPAAGAQVRRGTAVDIYLRRR